MYVEWVIHVVIWTCMFGHAARRPADEIIREFINPEAPVHWRKKRGGQLKTWMTTLKEDLARLSGPAVYGLRRLNQNWMTIRIAWAQDRGAWAVAVRDAVVANRSQVNASPSRRWV